MSTRGTITRGCTSGPQHPTRSHARRWLVACAALLLSVGSVELLLHGAPSLLPARFRDRYPLHGIEFFLPGLLDSTPLEAVPLPCCVTSYDGRLLATHLSAVLCVPSLVLLISSNRSGAGPRRVIPGLLVLATFAVLWLLVCSRNETGLGLARAALAGLAAGWDPSFAWGELVLPAGLLYPVALAAPLGQWRADRSVLRGPGPRTLLVLLLTSVPFAMTLHVAERGAYYSWALPGLALCAGRWLEAARSRQFLGLGVLVLPERAAGLVGDLSGPRLDPDARDGDR